MTHVFSQTQNMSIKIDNHNKNPGQISIPIEIPDGCDEVGSMAVHFQYNPNVLIFSGYADPFLDGMEANSLVVNGIHEVGIQWTEDAFGQGQSIPDGTTLINILFDYTGGESDLNFIQNKIEVTDNDFNPINVLPINGSVSPLGMATFQIPDLVEDPNTTITVPVDVDFSESEIPNGIASFELVIDFDASVLEYVDILNINSNLPGDVEVDVITSSRIGFTWMNPGSETIHFAGKLMDIRFSYGIGYSDIAFVENLCSVGDNQTLDANAGFFSGSVSQSEATIAEVSLDEIVDALPGQDIYMPLTVDFSGIPKGVSVFSFVIDFDENVLDVKQLANLATNFSTIDYQVIGGSRIEIEWSDDPSSQTGSSYAGKLLDIVFTFNLGETDLVFNEELSSMGNGDLLDVNVNYTHGKIHQAPSSVVNIYAATLIVDAGSQVDVPITVENFNDINAFDLHIEYDPGVLEYVELVNVSSAIVGDLDVNIIEGSTNTLALNWYSVDAISLADEAILFEIRYQFSDGMSDIVFDPLESSFTDTQFNELFAKYHDGAVSVEDPFATSVIIDDKVTQPGEVFIPVSVQEFNNVGAFTFIIQYNSSVASFEGIENKIQAFEDDENFMVSELQQSDKVTIVWNLSGADTEGLSVANGEKLFDLKFSFTGGSSDLTFDQLNSEVSDFSLMPVDVNFIDGSISSGLKLDIKVFLEGFFNQATGFMNKVKDVNPETGQTFEKFAGDIVDLITIELHEQGNYGHPVLVIDNVELLTDGTASFDIPAEFTADYYITVKHRNHLETVSKEPVSFASFNVEYDFTTAANKAFGNNMHQLQTGVFGLYAGDVAQTGTVVLTDIVQVNAAARANDAGYIVTDINGDGQVNLSDIIIVNARARAGIVKQIPN